MFYTVFGDEDGGGRTTLGERGPGDDRRRGARTHSASRTRTDRESVRYHFPGFPASLRHINGGMNPDNETDTRFMAHNMDSACPTDISRSLERPILSSKHVLDSRERTRSPRVHSLGASGRATHPTLTTWDGSPRCFTPSKGGPARHQAAPATPSCSRHNPHRQRPQRRASPAVRRVHTIDPSPTNAIEPAPRSSQPNDSAHKQSPPEVERDARVMGGGLRATGSVDSLG